MKKVEFRHDIIIRILLTIILVGILCFVCFCQTTILSWSGYGEYASIVLGEFKVCFFDVGQGDSTLIEYRDTTILIDAGPSKSVSGLCSSIQKVAGNSEIDFFILTHADSDHVGGGEEIFKRFEVKNFYRPKMLSGEEVANGNVDEFGVHDTLTYNNTISASYEENCDIFFNERGVIVSEDNFSAEILYPFSDDDLKATDSNSFSAVVRVTYADFTYLFMADADFEIEDKLISTYSSNLDCDVLKVAHHGSKYATSEEFLSIASPTYAVISVGEVGIDVYGHAGTEIKQRITDAGAIIYQTSVGGHILFGENATKGALNYKSLPSVPVAVVSATIGILVLVVWGVWLPKKSKN